MDNDITALRDEWTIFTPTLARLTPRDGDESPVWDHSLRINLRMGTADGVMRGVEARVYASDHPEIATEPPLAIEWWTEVRGTVQHVVMPRLVRDEASYHPGQWLAVEDEQWTPEVDTVGPRALWWFLVDEMPSEVTV